MDAFFRWKNLNAGFLGFGVVQSQVAWMVFEFLFGADDCFIDNGFRQSELLENETRGFISAHLVFTAEVIDAFWQFKDLVELIDQVVRAGYAAEFVWRGLGRLAAQGCRKNIPEEGIAVWQVSLRQSEEPA